VGVFLGIIGGIVGLVVGYIGAAVLSYLIMGALGVSDFEGERTVTSAVMFGPMGGLLGLGLGIWLALRLSRRSTPPRSWP
jgi:hypothetical protein